MTTRAQDRYAALHLLEEQIECGALSLDIEHISLAASAAYAAQHSRSEWGSFGHTAPVAECRDHWGTARGEVLEAADEDETLAWLCAEIDRLVR